jgi:hypothetical protein
MPTTSKGLWVLIPAMVDRMETVATPNAASAAGRVISRRPAVKPPAVVRGWMYDSTEHWWALLVGAPPAPC